MAWHKLYFGGKKSLWIKDSIYLKKYRQSRQKSEFCQILEEKKICILSNFQGEKSAYTDQISLSTGLKNALKLIKTKYERRN